MLPCFRQVRLGGPGGYLQFFRDLIMTEPVDHEEIEYGSVSRRKVLDGPDDLIVGQLIDGGGTGCGHLVFHRVQLGNQFMFLVFAEVVDGGIDHDLPDPAFKRADHIGISWLVMVYFAEHFQEPIVQDFNGIILFAGIPVANGHGIAIERAVDDLLALSPVEGTTLYMVGKFFGCQHEWSDFADKSGLALPGLPPSGKT